jgi:Protein of unknown function (DUF2510)
MTEESNLSAGWYVDPDDVESMRYYDGTRWTDQRMPQPVALAQYRTGQSYQALLNSDNGIWKYVGKLAQHWWAPYAVVGVVVAVMMVVLLLGR